MQAVVHVEEHDMNTFLDIWNMKMRKNYREAISRAKTGGKKPSWMSDDVWAAFQQYWQTEKAKVRYNENIYIYIDCSILHNRVSNVIGSSIQK